MSGRAQEAAARSLLVGLVARPESLTTLSLEQWDVVVRQARFAGILARLAYALEDLGALGDVPERPRSHLEAEQALTRKLQRDVRWEVACVREILAESGLPITLLKGAAYVMADLPPARGRLFSDIDFMVPKESIEDVERILLAADWISVTQDTYDQSYYRRWTHQIPPLQHYKRATVLDVHHTIVPTAARSTVDAEALAAASRPLGEDPQLRILAPADMVLHSAVHLFNEGEFHRGLRDLLDLDDLLRHFGEQPDFWHTLPQRAETLALTGPLYMTMRYREHLLGRPPPEELRPFLRCWKPSQAKRAAFDACFHRALRPEHATSDDAFSGFARWCLYVRSHYLRMPLHLLLPHLLRKALYRPEGH